MLGLDSDPMVPETPSSALPSRPALTSLPSLPSAIEALPPAWGEVRWVLTDVDDTLTLHGRLPPQSLIALERLQAAGLRVVAVTGACAGWCDHLAQAWPLDAVIGENGAFVMHRLNGRLQLESARPLAELRADQARLLQGVRDLLKDHPDLDVTQDQAYRLCEVAIDIGQHRDRVEASRVEALVQAIRATGAQATASSIHINAWLGSHSKPRTALDWLARHGVDATQAQRLACCIGDSPNDQGLFEALPLSAGVANIRRHWEELRHRPAWVMNQAGGLGFAEFADRLLARLSLAQKRPIASGSSPAKLQTPPEQAVDPSA
jgi:HAD superfamily hydrolase (TIGR01484 family)